MQATAEFSVHTGSGGRHIDKVTLVFQSEHWTTKYSVQDDLGTISLESWKRLISEDNYSAEFGFMYPMGSADMSIKRQGANIIFAGYQSLGTVEITVPVASCRDAIEKVILGAARS